MLLGAGWPGRPGPGFWSVFAGPLRYEVGQNVLGLICHPCLFCSGLLAACRISQVIPRALGEAHSGEFLHWPSSCVCPLFWPVFPPPWPVCAPDQSWKLCGRLLRNRVQRSHLLLGVPCVALHFLPTPSSSRKLEPHPAALSQPCAPGATSLPTPLLLPSAVSVVQTPDLPLPSQGV